MFVFGILTISVLSARAEITPSIRKPALVHTTSNENDYESLYLLKVYKNTNLQSDPPLNSFHEEENKIEDYYSDYVQRKPISSQANAKILNLGIQDTLVQPEIPKSSISMQGMSLVKQLAKAISILWYQPVMILLDDTKEVHRDADLFLTNLLSLSQIKAEFRLMKFNSSGVSSVLADTSTDKDLFLNLLKWTENPNSTKTSTLIAPEVLRGGAVFYGVLKAVRMLPEDSGIIVFTDRQVEDEDLAQLAVKEVREKNISLYVVWEGIYPTTKNEEKLIKEVALLTGGNFFVGNTERKLSELYSSTYLTNDDATQAKEVIAFYTNITGVQQRRFPVDSSVKSIHISITSPIAAATLTSAEGFVINILNNTAVEQFSKGSFSTYETGLGQYEIQLNTAGFVPTPILGIWRLNVDVGGLYAQGCNIIVSIQTRLNVTTFVAYKFDSEAVLNPEEFPKIKKLLRVALSGEFADIENITLLDKWGLPIVQNVIFTLQHKNKEPLIDVEDINSKPKQEADIDFNKLPYGPFYLKIWGEDKDGMAFSRLSYFDREKVNYLMQPLSVEVGAGSELLVMPNQYGKIFFEVTNNRDQVMYLYFMVQDEKSHLSRMEPRSSWVNPKQTVIVTVTTYASGAFSTSYRNLITFTVSGPENVQKSAAMYVSTNQMADDTEPRMSHRYTSDCTDILLGNCEDGSWVIEVRAEDKESGLLQLTSNPKGLYFPNGYIAGTKEPVVGLYGGSCCQSKIQLTVIDLQNNRRSYTADAYKAALSAGSISAIVLGILLFIIILIALICLCKIKCCKKKESVDLPTYRGPHGSQRRY